MNKNDLRRCLVREVERWSAKPYEALRTELRNVVAYVHVPIDVGDLGWRAFVPLKQKRDA